MPTVQFGDRPDASRRVNQNGNYGPVAESDDSARVDTCQKSAGRADATSGVLPSTTWYRSARTEAAGFRTAGVADYQFVEEMPKCGEVLFLGGDGKGEAVEIFADVTRGNSR